jgi:hypothetical protein
MAMKLFLIKSARYGDVVVWAESCNAALATWVEESGMPIYSNPDAINEICLIPPDKPGVVYM